MRVHFYGLIIAVGVLALLAGAASACNVPVYRFALERWHADAYRVTVLHRGPLDESQTTLLAALSQSDNTREDRRPANLIVEQVDLVDRTNAEAAEVGELPRVVVRYPQHLQIEIPVWTAPLDKATVSSLLDSPVRSELIRRLVAGETAVFLLLEGAAAAQNDEVAQRLESKLSELEKELKLPELTDAPEDNLLTGEPLKIGFSVLRLRRDDPREQALVGMLLRAEPDLFTRDDPMVYPVFGRGRALFPLVGPGITPDNIHESAAFLVGACSCEIKELNPGFDLLLGADWDQLVFGGAPPSEILAARSRVEPTEPEFVAIPAGSHGQEKSTAEHAVDADPAPSSTHASAKAHPASAAHETSDHAEKSPPGQSSNPLPVIGFMMLLTMVVVYLVGDGS